MPEKFFFAVFQADGIHHRFSLHAFEPCFDHAPLRAVDHDWNARDLRFAADQIQEAGHGRLRVDHPFVHVHVEKVRAALHLLTRHSERAVEIVRENQLRKLRRSRDVGALADDNEAELRRNVQRFESGKSQNHVVAGVSFHRHAVRISASVSPALECDPALCRNNHLPR